MKPPNLQSPAQVDNSSTCTQTLRNDSRPHFFYPWQHAGPRVSAVHWSGTFEMGDLFRLLSIPLRPISLPYNQRDLVGINSMNSILSAYCDGVENHRYKKFAVLRVLFQRPSLYECTSVSH